MKQIRIPLRRLSSVADYASLNPPYGLMLR
jgi:hypothetical protein